MRYFLTILLLIASIPAQADQDDAESLALRKSYPIQLYLGACVMAGAVPSEVEKQVIEMGFSEADDGVARQYLQGHTGKVWGASNEHGKFAVSLLDQGPCSVFVHQGNPEQLLASIEAWLPPEDSGFSFTKEMSSQSEFLQTSYYQIFRDDQLMENWVITVSSQPDSQLVAVMSYETQ